MQKFFHTDIHGVERQVSAREFDARYELEAHGRRPAPPRWIATTAGTSGRMEITVPPPDEQEIAERS